LRARLRAHTLNSASRRPAVQSAPGDGRELLFSARYEYISALWLTPQGSRFLIYGIVSEIIGILVIRRIASVRL